MPEREWLDLIVSSPGAGGHVRTAQNACDISFPRVCHAGATDVQPLNVSSLKMLSACSIIEG